ncbi:hypothetical protein F4W70_08670 [Pseudomonas cannabina]|nr:hypothetical protein [Pseudomonas cannabina]KAA8713878.1 hypothetical protein F4W70_08670 [Pseudomonas cannabina]
MGFFRGYLKAEVKQFDKTIYRMFDDYHEFKEQLRYLNPELSKKHFGFTLGGADLFDFSSLQRSGGLDLSGGNSWVLE